MITTDWAQMHKVSETWRKKCLELEALCAKQREGIIKIAKAARDVERVYWNFDVSMKSEVETLKALLDELEKHDERSEI